MPLDEIVMGTIGKRDTVGHAICDASVAVGILPSVGGGRYAVADEEGRL